MADKWKKLRADVKEKRTKNIAPKASKQRPRDQELVVQQLSAEVSGKAQKYSRVGPREFVPFEDDLEFTIENIKLACEKHFAPQIGANLVCDVLAGEQGPSCKTISHIPDAKVIYVRFVPVGADRNRERNEDGFLAPSPPRKRKTPMSLPEAKPSSDGRAGSSSRFAKSQSGASNYSTNFPKSLSVSDMLNLGKLNTKTSTTVVKLFTFDMELFSWSKVPLKAEFVVEKQEIGVGGFRKAYKATAKHPRFNGTAWVVKHYLPEALKAICQLGLTGEEHNRKVVQMHLLAKNFASQLEKKVRSSGNAEEFGQFLRYRDIYHGEISTEDIVTVEEFIPGQFSKFINNNGLTCVDPTHVIGLKAECLAHFSFETSNGKLILVDIQGNGYDLFDPEIASLELTDDDHKFMFSAGNLSEYAINNFVNAHVCNKFCDTLGLTPLSQNRR